ncbi:hypothetical protein [Paenibacillus harenae]|uniref:Uncharacterized protein n=1 Tax=Paenibacillus harenae TaxID=306543 RepID=A0ABT9U1H0_PAEHA|nr:hypothetical protein [Paenibacillus harenae]MDQ0113481.1 hypothetical protein [Paenibacillus harenae]
MKKIKVLTTIVLACSLVSAIPVNAGSSVGVDPFLSVYSSLSSSGGSLVYGSVTANSIAEYKTHVNVSGKLYKKGTTTIVDQGTGTSQNFYDAEWSTYADKTKSYTLQAAARTYFDGGDYSDQKFSTSNWN